MYKKILMKLFFDFFSNFVDFKNIVIELFNKNLFGGFIRIIKYIKKYLTSNLRIFFK